MGQSYDEIPDNILEWIKKQEMFWVATCPLSADGHINVSPKGYKKTIHAISKNQFWWEDLCGSSIETVAHLRDNKRITILFQAFEGPPRICRLFGTGSFHEYGSEEYSKYIPDESRHPSSRAVIVVDIHKVGTSCGYSVPFYQFLSHRTQLLDHFGERELSYTDTPMKKFWVVYNSQSIDGLPGMIDGPSTEKELKNCWATEKESYKEANARRLALTSKPMSMSTVQGKQSRVMLGKMDLPDWIDQRTVVSFLLGVLCTMMLSYARQLIRM